VIGRRRRWCSTAATIVGSAIVAVGPACTVRRPASREVKMQNFGFVPAVVTVAVGDTIVWTNADFVPHTATARDSAWDSKTIASDSAWRLVARAPGRHVYYCVFHPNMQGTVEVR
jgi:plastocyanin